MERDDHQLKFNVTLELDEKWASNFSPEELREYLKSRLDYSLGFRGRVKKLTRPRRK
jgi:hypothetical protein